MKKITKEQQHKIRISNIREDQKEQGCFDGRYRTKTEKLKTTYTRKIKHKNNNNG